MGSLKFFCILNTRGTHIVVRSFFLEPQHEEIDDIFSIMNNFSTFQPLFRYETTDFAVIFRNGLYFILATTEIASPTLMLEILESIISLITDYLGKCSENLITSNIALIYELVDEILAFGYPQTSDMSELYGYINNITNVEQLDFKAVMTNLKLGRSITFQSDIKPKSSKDLYVNVTESVNVELSSTSYVLNSLIAGQIIAKSYSSDISSGLLELGTRISLNDDGILQYLPVSFDDTILCPDCDVNNFELNRKLNFTSRLGKNTIMLYRSKCAGLPPFIFWSEVDSIQSQVVIITLKITSTFPTSLQAKDVVLHFLCPVEVTSGSCEVIDSSRTQCETEFDPVSHEIRWKIPEFSGCVEMSARFRFIFDDCIPGAVERILGPVCTDFSLRGYLCSGFTVESYDSSCVKSQDDLDKWVVLESVSGTYTYSLM